MQLPFSASQKAFVIPENGTGSSGGMVSNLDGAHEVLPGNTAASPAIQRHSKITDIEDVVPDASKRLPQIEGPLDKTRCVLATMNHVSGCVQCRSIPSCLIVVVGYFFL